MELWFEDSFQVDFDCSLGNAICQGRNTERSLPAIALGNFLLQDGWREVAAGAKSIPDLVKIAVSILIELFDGLAVASGSSFILSDLLIRFPHQCFWDFKYFSLFHCLILAGASSHELGKIHFQ